MDVTYANELTKQMNETELPFATKGSKIKLQETKLTVCKAKCLFKTNTHRNNLNVS
jgi:hypothetical protein